MISETNLYELHHRARLAIKPGITGMWQVSGRSDITDFEEVVRLDKEYITNWNIGLDILIATVSQIFVKGNKYLSYAGKKSIWILGFYTAMILLRTVLNREIWFDPLGKLFGGWGLYEDGQFTTESIENFMLFVPFSILLLWAFQKELLDESENIRFGKTVWEATKVVVVCELCKKVTLNPLHRINTRFSWMVLV